MSTATPIPQTIQRTYLVLLLFNTLAASFIWGINTLFLLDAGLTNTEAFLANSFFTVGQLLFEVPTGLVADLKGRRTSYLLGTITLALSTLLYLGAWYIKADLWLWAVASILLGLGFAFFSGATEAWLVDALQFAKYKGKMEAVFAKGQMVGGAAMLAGSFGGGLIAQFTNLSVPYLLRAGFLGITFVIAWFYMKDWGFTPEKSTNIAADTKKLFVTSAEYGWRVPAVRWLMIAAPFASGVGFYTFYAMQPYLLQLYGDPNAYGVAGLAAAIVAGAQIAGGMLVPHLKKWFKLRTSVLIAGSILNVVLLAAVGMIAHFWVVIGLLVLWGLVSAATQPVRQGLLNDLIPSKQRATVLSFDSMISSGGGAIIQPGLGKVADVWSYGTSFVAGAVVAALTVPFSVMAKKEKAKPDQL